MKKIFLLFITIVLAENLAHAQSNWATYKIDNILSVKLPTEPQRKDGNNMVATVKDSSVYFITIINMGIDTNQVKEMLNKPFFADGLKDAMLEKSPGFTVGQMKKGNWKGYTTFYAEGINASTHLKLYFSLLSINSYLYFLGNMVPENKTSNISFLDLLTLN